MLFKLCQRFLRFPATAVRLGSPPPLSRPTRVPMNTAALKRLETKEIARDAECNGKRRRKQTAHARKKQPPTTGQSTQTVAERMTTALTCAEGVFEQGFSTLELGSQTRTAVSTSALSGLIFAGRMRLRSRRSYRSKSNNRCAPAAGFHGRIRERLD